MVAAIVIVISIIWGFSIVTTLLGIWSDKLMLWLVGALFTWVIYFGLGSMLVGCPRCGRSVFMRGYFVSVPRPARTCGKCGQDLTVA